MIKNTTLAYFAGYIDGDGCFNIRKHVSKHTGNIKFSCSLIVSSTDMTILESFKDAFGGNVRLSSDKIITHKPQYHFSISGKKALALVQKIQPFLVEKFNESKIFCECILSDSKVIKWELFDKLKYEKKLANIALLEHIEFLKTIKKTQFPTEEDFAYFAGFIDAECSFGIQKYSSKDRPNPLYKAYIHCNNTKFPVFKWLIERFGGQARFIKRKCKNPMHRDQISWRISSKSLSEILESIEKFIRFKKPVCKQLMKFDKTTLKNGGARHTEEFRASYAKILIERDLIFTKVHLLNQKGV